MIWKNSGHVFYNYLLPELAALLNLRVHKRAERHQTIYNTT